MSIIAGDDDDNYYECNNNGGGGGGASQLHRSLTPVLPHPLLFRDSPAIVFSVDYHKRRTAAAVSRSPSLMPSTTTTATATTINTNYYDQL